MSDKTKAEVAAEREEALGKEYSDAFDESQKAAVDAREDEPNQAETDEEYYERVAAARASGIFGDTDTTAGVGASGIDVPSSDNEAATVAVSEADSKAALDEDADDQNVDDARRQVDVAAGTTASAEEVDEAADDDDGDDSDDDHQDSVA